MWALRQDADCGLLAVRVVKYGRVGVPAWLPPLS